MFEKKSSEEIEAEKAAKIMKTLGLNKSSRNDFGRYITAEILGREYESIEKVGQLHIMANTDEDTVRKAIALIEQDGVNLKKAK